MVYLKVLQAKILRFNAKIRGKLSFDALRLCIIPLGNTNQSTVLVSVFVFYGLLSSFDDPRAGGILVSWWISSESSISDSSVYFFFLGACFINSRVGFLGVVSRNTKIDF